MNRRLFSLEEISAVGGPGHPLNLTSAEVGIVLARFSEVGLIHASLRDTLDRLRLAAVEHRSRLLFDKFGRVAAYANWIQGDQLPCPLIGDAIIFHGYIFEALAYFKYIAPPELHYVRTYSSRRVIRSITKHNLGHRRGLADTQIGLGVFDPDMVVMRESMMGIIQAGEKLCALAGMLAVSQAGEHAIVGATVVRLSRAISLNQHQLFETGGFITWAWMTQDEVLARTLSGQAWCAGPCFRIVDFAVPAESVNECVEFVRSKLRVGSASQLVYLDHRGTTVAIPTKNLHLAWS